MSKGRLTFRQSDLVRALKAATLAGKTVRTVVIQDGKIVMAFVGDEPEVKIEEEEVNPWERIAN